MKTDNTDRLADPENLHLYIPGFEGILKKKLKKNKSPGGGRFDYRWKAEILIRSSPYSCVTSHKKLERSNIYFSSYRFNKEFCN